MKSSPESTELFFSSPPHKGTSHGPADEVAELAQEARRIRTLSPAVAMFLQDPKRKQDFLRVMQNQVELIKSRSQAFEDAHVTVFDKILLILTRNGNQLDHPPAIEYYCGEFLGVSNTTDQVYALSMLEQSTSVPTLLSQGDTPPPSDPRSSMEMAEGIAPSQRSELVHTHALSEQPLRSVQRIAEMEPQVVRLWNLYEKARADFQAVIGSDDARVIADNARFLRDTAENMIQYVKTKDFDRVLMAELHAVNDLAKSTAVSATGGKKRKFDVAGPEKVNEEDRKWHGASRTRRSPERHARYSPNYRHEIRNNRHPIYPRSELGRQHKVQGRGPSGIPYGYSRSRPVDSYHPY